MKKLITLLGAIICAALAALTGCSGAQTFTEKAYQSGDGTIESVTIDVTDRQLEISASDDEQVHIYYFDSEKEYLDINSDDNQLSVTLTLDKDWTDFIGTKPAEEYRKIRIQIPDETIVNLSANTTNENIEVKSLSFAEGLNLNSNGGNILCERVNVGKSIDLTAKNGDITGTVIGSWDDFSISCTIKKGDCNLPESKDGGAKTFKADCNNGNINMEFVN